MTTSIKHRGAVASAQSLRATLKALRVWESQWIDLSYAAGDARGAIPDNEQPQDWIDERDRLRRAVVLVAAAIDGANPIEAAMYADTPLSTAHPYNIESVRIAASLHWRIPQWALVEARKQLEKPALGIDGFQARIEGAI